MGMSDYENPRPDWESNPGHNSLEAITLTNSHNDRLI